MTVNKSALLSAASIIQNQISKFDEKLIITGTVPANGRGIFKVHVSTLGCFLLKHITGTFTTLDKIGDSIIDSGVNSLLCQFIDGYGNKPLFSDFVPMDLFLSPGRRKSSLAVNNAVSVVGVADVAAPSSTLFYPQEFQYMFNENTDIVVSVTNSSPTDNNFDICLHGIRYVNKSNIATLPSKR
jgi:hypothetical protein